ncbi:MAG: hypothetical protein JXN59_10555 [Anaerolineae bacterium]|nr:hypothetical protein [Anaerolineae bacterium]
MPAPSVVFAFILATMLGALFHLIVGGDVRLLALYLLAAWFGFSLGQLLGGLLEIEIGSIGVLRILPAVAGALLMLLGAHMLLVRPARQK